MGSRPPDDVGSDAAPVWQRDRKLARRGFKDLEYLPRARTGWNATLAALSFSARRRTARGADLNLWAALIRHGDDCAVHQPSLMLGVATVLHIGAPP